MVAWRDPSSRLSDAAQRLRADQVPPTAAGSATLVRGHAHDQVLRGIEPVG